MCKTERESEAAVNTQGLAQRSEPVRRGGMRGGGREAQEGVDTYTLRAGSCCHTAETNTTLQSNCPPIENKLKKENTQLNGVVRYL